MIIEAFPASQLPHRSALTPDGKLRNKQIQKQDLLRACALKELVQFDCDLRGSGRDPRSVVVCEPVVRLFRRCADGLTVETTAWEGEDGVVR